MSFQLPTTIFGPADLILRLGLAVLVGLLIGLDREWRGHAAGIRTHALVALSSAIVTLSALELHAEMRAAGDRSDLLRVVQGLAQAIGFIAAGTIFMSRGRVKDLTTAVSIWLAAALGIAAGAGQVLLVTLGATLALILLVASPLVDGVKRRGRRDDGESRPTE